MPVINLAELATGVLAVSVALAWNQAFSRAINAAADGTAAWQIALATAVAVTIVVFGAAALANHAAAVHQAYVAAPAAAAMRMVRQSGL